MEQKKKDAILSVARVEPVLGDGLQRRCSSIPS